MKAMSEIFVHLANTFPERDGIIFNRYFFHVRNRQLEVCFETISAFKILVLLMLILESFAES